MRLVLVYLIKEALVFTEKSQQNPVEARMLGPTLPKNKFSKSRPGVSGNCSVFSGVSALSSSIQNKPPPNEPLLGARLHLNPFLIFNSNYEALQG